MSARGGECKDGAMRPQPVVRAGRGSQEDLEQQFE